MQLSDIELPGINVEQELAESERQNQETRSKTEEEIVEVESQPVRSVDLTLRFSDIVRNFYKNYRQSIAMALFPFNRV